MRRRPSFARILLACPIVVTMLGTASRTAHAQENTVTAQALFDDGKRLMAEKKYGEACPKLAESQRLDPGGGTMLALALCHEAEGKTATAWADFKAAQADARRDHRADREAAAGDHIKSLESKLTKLLVTVGTDIEGLEVRRNGVVVGKAQWGTPIPVDPGEFQFDAQAPGKKAWSSKLPIDGAGKTVEVKVPALEDQPVAAASPAPASVDETRNVNREPAPAAAAANGGKNYVPALVAGSVAVAATGFGTFFGLRASSKWNDAKRGCVDHACPSPNAPSEVDAARSAADASTVAFVIGGVALATAGVLFFAAPTKERDTAVRVAPTMMANGGGLVLGGTLQ